MAAGKWAISLIKGDTFKLRFKILDAGVARNLTGWTVKMQVRQFATSTTKLLDITSANNTADHTITLNHSSVQGVVDIVVAAALISELPLGRLVYDIQFTSPGGEVSTELQGPFIVGLEVTQ
jgi:hypothetical protein